MDVTLKRSGYSFQGVPRPLTLLTEAWSRDAIEARGKPLEANRETKLVGQIGPALTATDEDYEKEAREHAAKVIHARELQRLERESKGSKPV
jgi:hypothetical protein